MPQNIANALMVCYCYIFAIYYYTNWKIQHHPPVPVDQYPGIPRHQIAHHDLQRIRRLRSHSPPPPPPMFSAQYGPPPFPQFNIPQIELPPIFPPAPLPHWQPQPFHILDQHPLIYQGFPQQPQQYVNVPQRSILEERVHHTAILLARPNPTYESHRNRRSNRRSSTPQSINAQAGPAHPPPAMQNIETYQHIIDFQHDVVQERQQQMQLYQQEEHRGQLGLQQQTLLQQVEYQRQLELQHWQEMQHHQQELEQQRLLQLHQHQWEIEQQRQRQQQLLALHQQELEQQRQLREQQQQELCQQEERHQSQENNALVQTQQLSQALLADAFSEHSQHSADQYEQDQQRQQQQNSNPGSPPSSPSPSPPPPPSPGPSLPRSPIPRPAPRSPSPPLPNPGPDPDPSDSSSSDSENANGDPQPPYPIPPGGRQYTEPVQIHSLGPMNIQCSNCHALHFISEKLSNSGVRNPRFGMCCLQGQVNLPPIQQWPRVLQDLFDDPRDPTEFRKKIRQYNNALAFTSLGVDIDDQAIQGSGPRSFRIHGSLHHLMGALIPPDDVQACFAQLYIYDPQEATDRHVQANPQLNPGILLDLHTTLRDIHPYAPLYK